MSEVAVILTQTAIIASGLYNGMPRHVNIPSTNPIYPKAKQAYKDGNYEDILRMGDISTNVEAFSDGMFFVVDGCVYTENFDEPAPKVLADRIVAFAKEDLPVKPLVNFWNKLRTNLDPDVRTQLYGFLEHNNIPITPDGCFVGYKKVVRGEDGHLWDSYTGNTFINDVGSVVKMDRNMVDNDPHQTCSTGLHIAAHEYANGFYGNTLVHCKVDPADVVSVPYDYNGQKMRVCKYEVIAVSEDHQPITSPLYGDDEPDYPDVDDEDLANEEDLYDATEDEYENDTLDQDDHADCDNCDDTTCPEHPNYVGDTGDDEPYVQDTDVITLYAHARHNGSVELPTDAVNALGVGTPVQTIISDETVRIIPCTDDERGCRTLYKGFRVSSKTLTLAHIKGWGTYAVEFNNCGITISVH